MVASRSAGKTLLVPVESGIMGISPQTEATRRLVPSPPSTTIAAAPASIIISTARSVSMGACSISISRKVMAGQGSPPMLSWIPIARLTPPAIPPRSGIMKVRATPTAPSPAMVRATMFDFSAVWNTEAWATRRRMSRPEAGLARMPTAGPPVEVDTGYLPGWSSAGFTARGRKQAKQFQERLPGSLFDIIATDVSRSEWCVSELSAPSCSDQATIRGYCIQRDST